MVFVCFSSFSLVYDYSRRKSNWTACDIFVKNKFEFNAKKVSSVFLVSVYICPWRVTFDLLELAEECLFGDESAFCCHLIHFHARMQLHQLDGEFDSLQVHVLRKRHAKVLIDRPRNIEAIGCKFNCKVLDGDIRTSEQLFLTHDL